MLYHYKIWRPFAPNTRTHNLFLVNCFRTVQSYYRSTIVWGFIGNFQTVYSRRVGNRITYCLNVYSLPPRTLPLSLHETYIINVFLNNRRRRFKQSYISPVRVLTESDCGLIGTVPFESDIVGSFGGGTYIERTGWNSKICNICQPVLDPRGRLRVSSSPKVHVGPWLKINGNRSRRNLTHLHYIQQSSLSKIIDVTSECGYTQASPRFSEETVNKNCLDSLWMFQVFPRFCS